MFVKLDWAKLPGALPEPLLIRRHGERVAHGHCQRSFIAHRHQLSVGAACKDFGRAQAFIVIVPTPVDTANRPDMMPLVKASTTVGKALKKSDVVIYESTVNQGATEEVYVPVLKQHSGFKFGQDFFCG